MKRATMNPRYVDVTGMDFLPPTIAEACGGYSRSGAWRQH